MHSATDNDTHASGYNTARFFTENRHIAWVLLIGTVLWGIYGYLQMPKRKDPEIPVRTAAAICPWPGATVDRLEDLVTRKIESRAAENASVERIESVVLNGVAVVYITLLEGLTETGREFDDIKLRLDGIRDLPRGAGPIQFFKDYGETAALMLTVASPPAGDVELDLRARTMSAAIGAVRAGAPTSAGPRVSVLASLPRTMDGRGVGRRRDLLARFAVERGVVRDVRPLEGEGFVGFDAALTGDDERLAALIQQFLRERLRTSEFHPDAWAPIVVRDPADTRARLAAVRGDKYTYSELDDFTDLVQKALQTAPLVSKVIRSGVLGERVYLEYSQERLASYGLEPGKLRQILEGRNNTLAGGTLEAEGKNILIDPSGEFRSEREIGDVVVAASASGAPVYLRDGVEITREYESPPRFLNFYSWKDAEGRWHRTRAITLAVQMRPGGQIGSFGEAVDATLADVRQRLPEDLLMARTSDQPLQVRETLDLFLKSLLEAIGLVVLVALLGFWEWRSALLLALSIPLTLAMTFGMMDVVGMDLQQASIASLIIALGLLVDDPVVAGDAIKRELAAGRKRAVAAWLGPTKLAKAILFATVANISAYLPLLLVRGDVGRFVYSLPVVITCSLVASRIVSMTFIPFLGYYLLRQPARPDPPVEERRTRGFSGYYYRLGTSAINHRWAVLAVAAVFIVVGGLLVFHLRTQFFPKDLSYLSYVDVWLPEDAPLSATRSAAERADGIVRTVAEQYGREHPDDEGRPREILRSVTTFTGGGGPRFWFSVAPEQQQLNYAQLVVQVHDKHDTHHLVEPWQQALSAGLPGARVDMRQLEAGKPVGIPVSIRISGLDKNTLRSLAEEVKAILRSMPAADRVRDDWGAESFVVRLQVDPDRATIAGVSNEDVAQSAVAAISGTPVTILREGDDEIPVVARLRMEERASLSDVRSLYVYLQQGSQKVPLSQVASTAYSMEGQKLKRRNQFRTITVSAFPVPGVLPSQVLGAAEDRVNEFARRLPPGYRLEIGGEYEEQVKGFRQLAIVIGVSIAVIFLALVIQFRNAIKPFIVFSAIPFGWVGALGGLTLMDAPFGFMGFLGMASLVGVIVSHIIVLFDFIEVMQERGEPLREGLLDAGIVRLRPILITVGATVLGLVPLALHGGPLWEPVCYAQIGGLLLASFITLLLVPVLYAFFVLDLKIIHWPGSSEQQA